jgi:hypothetical protein
MVWVQLFPPLTQASAVQPSPSSQLVAQQMVPVPLDTQCPLAQSVPSEQVAPRSFSEPQVVGDPQTVELGQGEELLTLQVPALSQVLRVSVEPVHEEPQAVPDAGMRHWPAPLQLPSSPQGVPEAVHALCASVPAVTG